MKTHHLAIAASIVTVGSALLSVACDQPRIRCATSTAPYWMVYTPAASDPAACSQVSTITKQDAAGTQVPVAGEQVTMSSYNPTSKDPARDGGPDLATINVYIRPQTVWSAMDTASAQGNVTFDDLTKTWTQGTFDLERPNDQKFCPMTKFTNQLDLVIPAVAATPADNTTTPPTPAAPAIPQTEYKYEWSNVQGFMRPDSLSLQISATVVRTVAVQGQTPLVCHYTAVGLSPPVSCDDGTGNPSDAICQVASADPDAGNYYSVSGINPDFKVKCDKTSLMCVLDGDLTKASSLPILKSN